MSVVSSLYTGAAGLSSHGEAISVLGDNIANANTVGFKGSRANFEDVLARSVGGGGLSETGLGSRLAGIQRMLTQGAMLGTGNATDLAIKGDGFFIVKGNADGLDGNFFTRAGQFHLDKDGKLVNANDLVVQGYSIDANGNLVKSMADIQVNTSQMPPAATTTAQIVANLDAQSTTPTAAWNIADPSGTSNYSTTVQIYDSLGTAHTANVYFRKDSAGNWSWHALVNASETSAPGGTGYAQIAGGTLTFDTQGRLQTASSTASAVTFTGAAASNVTFSFGDPIGSGGTGLKGVTDYASTSAVTYIDQNGHASGSLAGISVESNGMISGVFSNGMKLTVGQILLADFQNAQDMQRIGGNLFIATDKSGPALIAEAAAGGRGSISGGALEQSNVDLASQFVDMITYQRGFQANSKTITTADTMIQEVLGLKR